MHVQLKCPSCNSRVIDMNAKTVAKAEIYKNLNEADFYIKCSKCKNEIGIKKIQ